MKRLLSRFFPLLASIMTVVIWWYWDHVSAQGMIRPPSNRTQEDWILPRPERRLPDETVNEKSKRTDRAWKKIHVDSNTDSNAPAKNPPTPVPFVSQNENGLNILDWFDSPGNYGSNNFLLKPDKKPENIKKKIKKRPRMHRFEK